MTELIIIGGGLAGCEAAFQAAERGIDVMLCEMRPKVASPAHISSRLAELVCSNSLGSRLPDRATGLLFTELSRLNSLLVRIALETCVPSGSSLSVDRDAFSAGVEQVILNHPKIHVIRKEIREIPDSPTIIASGPLTSPGLSDALIRFSGKNNLFFYDAIAPIIHTESIDFSVAFYASRFEVEKGSTSDYINCPFTKEEYDRFTDALLSAERTPLQNFENEIQTGVKAGKGKYFEGCLPVEVIATRGHQSLCFGPMRPIGLMDSRTGQRPYAVLQLRQDNHSGSLYNMVGFQTNLTILSQKRVFRMVPGLAGVEFSRFGQMHRNTYLSSPSLLLPTSQTKRRSDLFLAGQITGIEGYLGNIASGLLAGINAANFISGRKMIIFPSATMIGALYRYITETPAERFQPVKASFGILPELENRFVIRQERAARHIQAATRVMDDFLNENMDSIKTT